MGWLVHPLKTPAQRRAVRNVQLTALGRVGVPDDIGGAIASLLADGNRWVNAQRIEVAGGMLI